jgi:hypothetical protein
VVLALDSGHPGFFTRVIGTIHNTQTKTWHHVFVPYITILNVTIPHITVPNERNNPEIP